MPAGLAGIDTEYNRRQRISVSYRVPTVGLSTGQLGFELQSASASLATCSLTASSLPLCQPAPSRPISESQLLPRLPQLPEPGVCGPQPPSPHICSSLVCKIQPSIVCVQPCSYTDDQIKGSFSLFLLLQPWLLEIAGTGPGAWTMWTTGFRTSMASGNQLSFIDCSSGCPEGLLTLGPRPARSRSCRWEIVGFKPGNKTSLTSEKWRRRPPAALLVWSRVYEGVLPRDVAAAL